MDEAEHAVLSEDGIDLSYLTTGFNAVMPFIEACTAAWQAAFSPSWLLCIDESMVQWKGLGSAHLTFIKRKPTPLGLLWRTLTCGISGILLDMEPQDAARIMDDKPFTKEWGKHTAVTLRLT